ncbi:MAG: hypothetical protein GX072_09265 [Lysinibacillus sp.]|nr:hypothetical protein [Lysinibacillus sp.]
MKNTEDMEDLTMTSIMIVMEDIEEDVPVDNIRFSRSILSSRFIHHFIVTHTTNNLTTVVLSDFIKRNRTYVN